MARSRSPEYPAIGLKEALEKARRVYDKDHTNKISKQVMAAHMGYKSLNGNSLTILSALSKFGLIEGRGDETQVSDLALMIFAHEPGTKERVEAINTAALSPDLFAELNARYPGQASDAGIRSYLLTHRFIPGAADAAIRSYRETKDLVEAENEAYARSNPEAAFQVEMNEREQQAMDDGLSHFPGRGNRASPPNSVESASMRKEIIALDEGDVVIMFPDGLSTESVADLNDHLQLFIRKAQRRAGIAADLIKEEAAH